VQVPFSDSGGSLRSPPLVAKIYAKKAASTGFTRSGGEPLASLADAGGELFRSLRPLY